MGMRVHEGQAREDSFTRHNREQYIQTAVQPVFGSCGRLDGRIPIAEADRQGQLGALFVDQWTAPFLIIGNYNKIVKQHGSDALSRRAA
jgi:hypothetical protein